MKEEFVFECKIEVRSNVSFFDKKGNSLLKRKNYLKQVRSGKDLFYGFMIFPNTETQIVLPDQISTETPYVGILINYQYATNRHGEFGLTAQHNAMTNEFIHLEEFAK